MTNLDTRTVNRDSFFLLAPVRHCGSSAGAQMKIRNLSAGGAMAEGAMIAQRGDAVEVELRNLGWVTGLVAWTHDNRFGIAFTRPIDAALARSHGQSGTADHSAIIARRPPVTDRQTDPAKVRAI